MINTNSNIGLRDINFLKDKYDKFLIIAKTLIKKTHNFINDSNIKTTEIKNNSFEFPFWGLDIIIKTEITYDNEKNRFKNGELNAYIKKENDLVLSYTFDNIGNVNNFHRIDEFAQFYYTNFFMNILKHSVDENIKFQLI